MIYKGYYITFGYTKIWDAHASHVFEEKQQYASFIGHPLATFAGNKSKSLAEYRAKEFINNQLKENDSRRKR